MSMTAIKKSPTEMNPNTPCGRSVEKRRLRCFRADLSASCGQKQRLAYLEGRGFHIARDLKGLAGQGFRSHAAQRVSEEAPFQRVVCL